VSLSEDFVRHKISVIMILRLQSNLQPQFYDGKCSYSIVLLTLLAYLSPLRE